MNIETKLTSCVTENSFTSGTLNYQYSCLHVVDCHGHHPGSNQPDDLFHPSRTGSVMLSIPRESCSNFVEFHFKIFVVKSAKGDIPTDGITSTPFVNLTGNNLLDYVNYKRYKIIKQWPLNTSKTSTSPERSLKRRHSPSTESTTPLELLHGIHHPNRKNRVPVTVFWGNVYHGESEV